MDIKTDIVFELSDVIRKSGELSKRVDLVIQAGLEKVVKAYVDEAPANIGDLIGEVKSKRKGILDYIVETTATTAGGVNYPAFLASGTGKMKGKPDFGYTTGRVRAGDVAYGIGGIRPNKFAARAKKKVNPEFLNYIRKNINLK